MEHDRNPQCIDDFNEIKRRLGEGNDKFENQGNRLVKLEANFENLTRSMDRLTMALWGVTASIMATLIGFLLWYIQNK